MGEELRLLEAESGRDGDLAIQTDHGSPPSEPNGFESANRGTNCLLCPEPNDSAWNAGRLLCIVSCETDEGQAPLPDWSCNKVPLLLTMNSKLTESYLTLVAIVQ